MQIARGCVASRSIAPLAGNRYKVATTHAQRALLLAERENYGEGLEGSHNPHRNSNRRIGEGVQSKAKNTTPLCAVLS